MFYRKCGCCSCMNACPQFEINENDLETKCSDVSNYNIEMDECACGFEENNNGFPDNAVLGQSYVPWQVMNNVFKPEVGLKNGTIFPELVSPYCPNQSIEEIEYIRMSNKIGKGCNG